MIAEKEPVKTGFFKVMEQEILIWNEKNDNPYRLYEHLKRLIKMYDVDYETGIKIITDKLRI